MNVLADFNPTLPEAFRTAEYVMLGNLVPDIQRGVVEQMTRRPKLVVMDTMNFWISSKKPQLLKVLKKVNVLLINETEAKILTESDNAIEASHKLHEHGVAIVVIKRGEYGFVMSSRENGFFMLPAMPISRVIDPTGAGDTFAGGFFGYLSSLGRPLKDTDYRQACVVGAMTASFTIENFGVKRISEVTRADLETRMSLFEKVITI